MAYSERQSYRVRRHRRRFGLRRWLFLGGGVLALAALVFLFLLLFTNVFQAPPQFLALPVSPGTKVLEQDGCLYYLTGTTLNCTDKKGETLWTTKFSAGQQDLAVSSKLICLYNESSATVIDTQKNPLFTVPQSDFQIMDVVCGNSSLAMLCKIDEEGTPHEYIRIFDTSGAEINRVDLKTSEALKFGFSGDGDNLWYLTLDTTGVYPISQITTLVPTQNSLTGLYSIYDELVSDVRFLGTEMYVAGTTYLASYDTIQQTKTEDTLIYGTKCVAVCESGDDILFAFAPRSTSDGSEYTVRLLSKSGVDTLLQLPDGILYFALSRNYVYCYSADTVYVYKTSGEFVKTIPLDFTLTGVTPLTDSTVLLRTETALYVMNLD